MPRNPAARREMSELADLVGAVRLPSGTHRRVAGTDAITDLLIFRRRAPEPSRLIDAWVRTQEVDLDGGRVRGQRATSSSTPARCSAQLKLAHGMYAHDDAVVEQRADVRHARRPCPLLRPASSPNTPAPPPAVRSRR